MADQYDNSRVIDPKRDTSRRNSKISMDKASATETLDSEQERLDNSVPNDKLDTVMLALRFSVQTMKLLGQPSHKVKKILTHGYTGRFCMVFDIAMCPTNKRLFIADVKYVHIFDPVHQMAVGGFKTKVKTVLGLSVMSSDRIALTDVLRRSVLIYNTKGDLIRQFGSGKALQNTKLDQRFSFPAGIAHYGGRLYIADTNKHRISVWSKRGRFHYHITNDLMYYPDRITVNLNGDLLVRSSNQNAILVLDPDGHLKTRIDRGGAMPLDTPTALCMTDKHLKVTGRADNTLCIDMFDNNWGHLIRFGTNVGADHVSGIASLNGTIFVGKRSEIYIF